MNKEIIVIGGGNPTKDKDFFTVGIHGHASLKGDWDTPEFWTEFQNLPKHKFKYLMFDMGSESWLPKNDSIQNLFKIFTELSDNKGLISFLIDKTPKYRGDLHLPAMISRSFSKEFSEYLYSYNYIPLISFAVLDNSSSALEFYVVFGIKDTHKIKKNSKIYEFIDNDDIILKQIIDKHGEFSEYYDFILPNQYFKMLSTLENIHKIIKDNVLLMTPKTKKKTPKKKTPKKKTPQKKTSKKKTPKKNSEKRVILREK